MRRPILLSANPRLTAAATSSDFRVGVRADDEKVDLLVHGVIGDSWDGLDSGSVSAFLAQHKGKRVHVDINSFGGLAFDGIATYNALVAHGSPVHVHISGMAASAASIIAMAGDHITIAENAQMMIHRAWGIVVGNTAVMKEASEWLDAVDDSIAATYAARTGRTKAKMLQMMVGTIDGTTMSGKQAVEEKFADEVIPLKAKKKQEDEQEEDEDNPMDAMRAGLAAEAKTKEREAVAVRMRRLELDGVA